MHFVTEEPMKKTRHGEGSRPKKIRCKHDRQHGILHTVDDKTLRKGGLRTAFML